MGVNQSKEELLYQQVNFGNIEGVKALHREGARLEFIDKEGKTPLILACMRSDLLPVAKALIEMGANVNAYRPGRHAGTPLHHAAKRGLESTVILLLSHGANPLVMNDDCETPLELARTKGHTNVVRAIENRICLFAGWLREINGPSIFEAFVPQWVSKKIWAVVLPCDSRNPTNPKKFELAIYPVPQVSQPRTIIALWKAQIEEPKFNHPDPALIIADTAKKTRSKFLSALEGDKRQIQWFYNACRGIYQHTNIVPAPPPAAPPFSTTSTPNPEDVELAMAINASIQTALVEGVSLPHSQQNLINAANEWGSSSTNPTHNGWGPSVQPSINVGASGSSNQPTHNENTPTKVRPNSPPQLHTAQPESLTLTAPSAPPISDEAFYGSPIQYPSIDSSPVDFSVPPIKRSALSSTETKEDSGNSASSSTCVICLDKPVEGACIPCGHMAGCMSCLKEIKEKRGECPVCRAKIAQVVRLYAV
ncbi:probable E3 ubiquitin-protein ligase XBOS34 [Phalaenopsis equestris]|uniref:probable E3 ubiquitin-protein ligase XBOS34 n=1 Tax=Phalaenopsis equestris TaxID=78828 RepID=UPI0009E5ABD1|nr:probable E3 ubiquitin-protein ligase XBOS34 [Phalaenopsis equestris]XP_020584920.1 probable E3 ubiquitin-protein ligase XBOS34 [Phalaenopsis equestris]